jgi:hypothetical protein
MCTLLIFNKSVILVDRGSQWTTLGAVMRMVFVIFKHLWNIKAYFNVPKTGREIHI